MPRPSIVSRVEIVLGLALWVVVGATAAFSGAFWDWLAYAAPVAALVLAWPIISKRRWSIALLDWLPVPFVVLTYEMLHDVVPDCWRTTLDAWLSNLDRSLLGDHAAVLLDPLVSKPLTIALAACYAAYYPMTIGVAVWFYARKRRVPFREYVAGEVGALFIGYLGYLFLPALGPYAWLPGSTWSVPLDGDFIRSMNLALYDIHACFPRDAFPSLHTANAVTILLVTARHDRRALRTLLVPCVGLIVATVYLRIHYVVDVVAGAALAVAWQAFVPRLVAREPNVAV